jgi:hypothetical protein
MGGYWLCLALHCGGQTIPTCIEVHFRLTWIDHSSVLDNLVSHTWWRLLCFLRGFAQ